MNLTRNHFPLVILAISCFTTRQVSFHHIILLLAELDRIVLPIHFIHPILLPTVDVIECDAGVLLIFHQCLHMVVHAQSRIPHPIRDWIAFHHLRFLSLFIIQNDRTISILSNHALLHSLLIQRFTRPVSILILQTTTVLVSRRTIILSNTQ